MPVGQIDQEQVESLVTDLAAKAAAADLTTHVNDTANPHGVNAAQVGAYTTGQVDTLLGDASNIGPGTINNTEFGYLNGVTSSVQTQLNAKAATSALTAHTGNTSNPHSVTAAQVGAISTSAKGANNGVAELDANGRLPASQAPVRSLIMTKTVANETARFALTTDPDTGVQNGDFVLQSDTGEYYSVIDDTNLDSAAGYLYQPTGGGSVTTVFGRSGPYIEAVAGDYDSDQINNNSTVNGGSGSVSDALEANASAISTVDGKLADASNLGGGSVSNTEFGYLDGVTSSIQTQLDDLASDVSDLQPAAALDLVPSGTVNGTNRDFLLQSGAANVPFSDIDGAKIDVYVKRLWQIPGTDYTIIDNGSGSAMVRFTSGAQPLDTWPIHTRGTVA